jgi:hypothetical protein
MDWINYVLGFYNRLVKGKPNRCDDFSYGVSGLS